VALRWPILAAWIAAVVLTTIYLPSFESSDSNLVSAIPPDLPAVKAEYTSYAEFKLPVLSRDLIVQRSATGLSSGAQQRVISRALALNLHQLKGFEDIAAAFPVINVAGVTPSAKETGTTAVTYLFFQPSVGPNTRVRLENELVKQYINQPDDGQTGITGTIPLRQHEGDIILTYLPIIEIASIVLIIVVVGIAFRSVVAPFVVLAPAVIAYLVSTRLVGGLSQETGLTVPHELRPLLVVLLLGVTADYAVFYLFAARAEFATGTGRVQAAIAASTRVTPIVFAAALTVAASTATLLLAKMELFRSLGPGMAISVLTAGLAAITLFPAFIGIFGRLIFWPVTPEFDPHPAPNEPPGLTSTLARLLRHRTVALVLVVVTVAVLVWATIPVRHYHVGFDLISELPDDNSAVTAANMASSGFAPGIVAPLEVLVQANGVTKDTQQLQDLQNRIEQQPGVAGVLGPKQLPFTQDFGIILSSSGNAARYVVILDSRPYSQDATNTLSRLQEQMPGMLQGSQLTGAKVSFAGDTAISAELVDRAHADLIRVGIGILVVDLIVLCLFLRSVVAPILLLLCSVLTVVTAIGITTWVFIQRGGYDSLTYYVPFAVAVLLVSFGTDYTMFLAGQIWQEAESRPLAGAILRGTRNASSAVWVAGVILALSFALLALIPLGTFRQFAVAMVAGLLLDAFVVQSLLAPALFAFFGTMTGWPNKAIFWRTPKPEKQA
jgi:RND superfamily putative drug exporter